jgi:hypothetical protein
MAIVRLIGMDNEFHVIRERLLNELTTELQRTLRGRAKSFLKCGEVNAHHGTRSFSLAGRMVPIESACNFFPIRIFSTLANGRVDQKPNSAEPQKPHVAKWR